MTEIYEFSQQKLAQAQMMNLENFSENLQNFNKNYFFLINFSAFADFVKKLFENIFFFLKNGKFSSQISKPRTESRYNFASLLGGAKILEKNPDCLYEKSVLDDNPDNYMINKCESPQKYVIIRLSEDILMNEFLIINREFYSSNLKNFEVLGCVSSSMNEWKSLGNFTAKNQREWQNFQLKKETWVRFVKFVFVSHYGNAYHCTLSQIKIFGETMLADFRNDLMKNLQGKSTISNQTLEKKEKKPANSLNFSRNASNFSQKVANLANLHKNSSKYWANRLSFSMNRSAKSGRTPWFSLEFPRKHHNFSMNRIIVEPKAKENASFQEDCAFLFKDWLEIHKKKCLHKRKALKTRANSAISHTPIAVYQEFGDIDLGVESIFKVLTKHIKALKENQELLHEFIDKQESLNTEFSSNFEVSLKLAHELFDKSLELHKKVQALEANNTELSQQLTNISSEITQMRTYLEIEADFFIWKVLIIALLSCLSCFIVNYCVSNLFDARTLRNDREIRYFSQKNAGNSNIFEDFVGVSPKNRENSAKSARKDRKNRKKMEKTKSEANSLVNLQNRRFSQAFREASQQELLRKRSVSVEEKRYLWGISPKQFSKYFFSKFVSAL